MTLSEQVITPVLSRILETMYFCDPEYAGTSTLAAPVIGASLDFRGSRNGRFRILVSERLASRLTGDFLAADADELTHDQLVATVRELANVACGATINAWMPQGDFHCSVPGDIPADELSEAAEHCFRIDGSQPELAVDVIIADPA